MTDRAPAIQITGLVKRYPTGTGVNGLDLTIEQHEVFGLLGPNGAGKTTTIETLVGLRRPTSGEVRVLGLDPSTDRTALRRMVAVQPQHAALLPNLTVRETLRLWASLYDHPASILEVLDSVGLTAVAGTRVRRLSGGQERRLLVATALIARPRLLLLDEPSLGLDPNARADVWEVVLCFRERGGTVLLTTNSMEEAEALSDRVAIMDRGQVVACATPARLIAAYAPEPVISFARDASPGHSPAALRTLPRVAAVDVRGGRVHVRTGAVDEVTAILLAGPAPARDLSVHRAGLDDVFRALTGHALGAGPITSLQGAA